MVAEEDAMTVKAILEAKGHAVVTLGPNATLTEAVGLLADRRIGALVITNGDRKIVGILSERDVVRVIAKEGAAALDMTVRAAMTPKDKDCNENHTVNEIMEIMTAGRFRHLPVAKDGLVADINMDMPILTYRFEDMVAFGGDRSTLGPVIGRALAGIGVTLSPDPMPGEAIFVRSDHFNFVRRGIPAVFLWPGPKGPGKAATDDFMNKHYHRPSDDLTQPILWDQAVRFVDANYRIAREIADADTRPLWNRGDYFAGLFDGPMAP